MMPDRLDQRRIRRGWRIQQVGNEGRIPTGYVNPRAGLNNRARFFRRGLHNELIDRDTYECRRFLKLCHQCLRKAGRDAAPFI